MLFNSVVFLFAFLPVTYVVFWLLRSTRARYIWLAVTGYVFYGVLGCPVLPADARSRRW